MDDLEKDSEVFQCTDGFISETVKLTIGSNVRRIPAYLCGTADSDLGINPCRSRGVEITYIQFENNSVCAKIGSQAFYRCDKLKTVEIPSSIRTIGRNAFKKCYEVSDIYYGGTGAEWDEIIYEDHGSTNTDRAAIIISSGNAPLLNADIYFNSFDSGADDGSGEDDENESSSNVYVRYFREWDAENQVAYFGSTGLLGIQVIDPSIREIIGSLVGSYVLVESKSRDDSLIGPDILISIEAVDSKTGTVTAANTNTITIANETYGTPQNVFLPESMVGDFVLYHTYKGELIEVVSLSLVEGQLTYWNTKTRELTLRPDGLNEVASTYVLSDLADEDTVSFLGSTGLCNVPVYYYLDSNFVFRVRYHDPDFNKPKFDYEQSEEDIMQGYLLDYLNEFLKAYNEPKEGETSFADEVCSALIENAGIDLDQIREDAINQRAQEMKTHDGETNKDQFIADSFYGEEYVDIAYKALATYFYDVTKNGIPDLSKIDVTDTFAGSNIVTDLIKNISTENKVYSIDGKHVVLNIHNTFGPDFGTIDIGSRRFVVAPREEDCRDALSALVTEMKDLASNAAYSMADSVYKEILGKSLTSLAGDAFGKAVENFAKKFDKPLEEVLKKAGLDNVLTVVNKCYSFYKTAEKAINALNNDDVVKAIEQIEKLEFKEIKINNWAVDKSKKALNKAIEKMKEAFEWYLEGTLIEHEESFWNVIFGCPIEIAIYNANGEQIGFVSDEECWYSDALIIRRHGDIKKISVLIDEIPTFVITATDYGTMSCCIEECDDDYKPTGRMLFYDVSLIPEKTFKLTPADDLKSNADNIALVSGNESIYADQFIPMDERTSVSVSCDLINMDAGMVYGTGVYARGDVAMLCAVANEGYEFIGWYDGDVLLDDGITYEFITKENRTLTAKFAEISTVNVEVYNGVGGTSTGSGIHQKNTNVTLTAYANDGYTFDGWYLNNELECSDNVYTFLVDTDMVLEARFVEHAHAFRNPVFNWEEDYSCYAEFACENCDYGKYVVCTVTSTNTPATESENGETVYTATAIFNRQTYSDSKTVIIPATGHMTHIPESQWMFNTINHWHTCTGCEEIMDIATHSGGTATCMEKAICTVCNQSYGEKDTANHTGSTTITGRKDATCGTDGYTGDMVCECGEIIARGEMIPATSKHTGGAATCKEKAICKSCGQPYGKINPKNHSFTKYHSDHNATCKKNGTKTAKCDYGCGKTDTVTDRGSKLGHQFDGNQCVRCGLNRWNPDTGDKIMIAVAVLVISGAALLILVSRKKRK